MFTKYLTVILIILSVIVQSTAVFAQTRNDKETEKQTKLQTEITKIGVGKDAGIVVKLKDGTKLNGYVSARDNDGFDLTDKKSGSVRNIKFAEVKSVRDKKLSRGATTAIGLVIGIGGAIGLLYLICSSGRCAE